MDKPAQVALLRKEVSGGKFGGSVSIRAFFCRPDLFDILGVEPRKSHRTWGFVYFAALCGLTASLCSFPIISPYPRQPWLHAFSSCYKSVCPLLIGPFLLQVSNNGLGKCHTNDLIRREENRPWSFAACSKAIASSR